MGCFLFRQLCPWLRLWVYGIGSASRLHLFTQQPMGAERDGDYAGRLAGFLPRARAFGPQFFSGLIWKRTSLMDREGGLASGWGVKST